MPEDTLHGEIDEPTSAQLLGNADPQKLSSNEQKAIPLFAGETVVSAMWIGEIYDQFTVEAPVERPDKK